MAWQPPASDAVSSGAWQPPASDAVGSSPDQSSSGMADVLQAVKSGAQKVLSQPDVQPFNGINPFSKPEGGPVQQVLGSMRQVASLPLRYSQTLGQASQPVADFTAEKLGAAGVNPYVSAAAGMVAGAAVDPRSWVPGSQELPKTEELPVTQPGFKTGEPKALFAYNDQFGPNGTQRSLYNVFGAEDHPTIQKVGWGSSISKADLDKAGIPVVGRQPNSMQYQPLDNLSKPSSQGFLADRGGVAFEHPSELPENIAQQREARTGVPARDFQRLYQDPGALLKGGNVKQAGANIGAAKEAAGINPGVTNDLSSLTPENIDRINPTKAIKIDDINTVIGKITGGQKPSPQEAQNALDSVNSILGTPSVQNNRDIFRQWSAIKTHLNKALGDVAPSVRAANAAYAREKLGQAFSPMAAVNKTGTPSKLAMLAQQVPGAVGGAIGGTLFGPAGAVGGYEVGKTAANLYHAPLVAGLQTAAGSIANKAVDPLLSALEKMGTSPAVQALVARYLQQKSQ